MSNEQLRALIETVGGATGLALSAHFKGPTLLENCEFRIRGLEEPDGFSLAPFRTALGIGLKTKWDLFSADLVKAVENFYKEDSAEIAALENSFPPDVTFMKFVNGSRALGNDLNGTWRSIDFQWITPVEEIDSQSEWKSLEILLETSTSFLFDVLSSALMTDNAEGEGKIEGFTVESKCGRYSRSATNRKACLRHFGYICAACGFEPAEVYGPDGIGVIHVHHLTPLSAMTTAGPVSPIEDLVPLCANCHNFAHRKNPPYTPEEIRESLKK